MQNILFNVEMTKAILDGRKVQTRRVVKSVPNMSEIGLKKDFINEIKSKAKYQIDETIQVCQEVDCIGDCNIGLPCQTCGSSQGIGTAIELKNIFLKITNIRVERLQDAEWWEYGKEGVKPILDRWDCCPETGMPSSDYETPFKNLWNKTAPKGYKWEDNPYVFVYEFERVENI